LYIENERESTNILDSVGFKGEKENNNEKNIENERECTNDQETDYLRSLGWKDKRKAKAYNREVIDSYIDNESESNNNQETFYLWRLGWRDKRKARAYSKRIYGLMNLSKTKNIGMTNDESIILIRYDGDSFQFDTYSDMEEMKEHLIENEVQYIFLMNFKINDDEWDDTKNDIFISWTGPKATRGFITKKYQDEQVLKELLFTKYELTVDSKHNFTRKEIIRCCSPKSGTHHLGSV